MVDWKQGLIGQLCLGHGLHGSILYTLLKAGVLSLEKSRNSRLNTPLTDGYQWCRESRVGDVEQTFVS